jgi:sigma-B regulation protein RsbU (phosphoserine phosphatase)
MGDQFIIKDQQQILRRIRPPKSREQAISKLVTDRYYVHQDDMIDVLADNLRRHADIQAVGVVDDEERVVGVIVREEFFNVMVRPYALDVFKHRPVHEIVSKARTFSADANLFQVAEALTMTMKQPGISYFVLTDSEGRFRGVFSTQDMLVYLSDMTQSDIALARDLQSRIVREREFVTGDTFELTAAAHTAKGVGGDFYDVREYDDGKWMFAFCDVSGKGIAASIVTAVISGMIGVFDFKTHGVIPFVKRLNDYIVRTFEAEKYVTGVFLDYDERTGMLKVCDMGHSHLFLYRTGRFVRLRNSHRNLPVGVVADVEPGFDEIRPRREDMLFLLTDGLIEQADTEGTVYSIERVARVLRENDRTPVEMIADRLLADFNSFRGRHHLNDDVSFALMRFVEQELTL